MMNPELNGLEGVSDNELEGAVDSILGGRTDRSQSATPPGADPQGNAQPNGEADLPPIWKQLGYESPEAAVQGVRHLRSNRGQMETEKNEWKERYEQLLAGVGGARMSPSTPEPDELETLDKDFHVDRRLLERAIDKRVEDRVNGILQPLVAMTQADQQMARRYGDEYVRQKQNIDAFVASDPHVSKVVQTARERGMPEVAAEYALKAYTEHVVMSAHEDLVRGSDALGQQTANSRRQVQPMQSREHSRTLLAQQQAGGLEGIDRKEAIRRANAGDDRMIDAAFASQLPSEESLLRIWKGDLGR